MAPSPGRRASSWPRCSWRSSPRRTPPSPRSAGRKTQIACTIWPIIYFYLQVNYLVLPLVYHVVVGVVCHGERVRGVVHLGLVAVPMKLLCFSLLHIWIIGFHTRLSSKKDYEELTKPYVMFERCKFELVAFLHKITFLSYSNHVPEHHPVTEEPHLLVGVYGQEDLANVAVDLQVLKVAPGNED